ncbi:MAG TPA: hypothetical protein VI685_20865 [Candidatus Angelobacter sp.]
MKLRTVVSLMLTGLLLSAMALAQNKPSPEKTDPLVFMKLAGDVAGNVQQQSLDSFLGIYVDEQSWASGAKDSDLGAFLKFKEAKPGRSAAFFFNEAKDTAICVYFDGESPFGVVAVKAGSAGAIKADDISAAYKPVSKDMLKKGDQEWHFSQFQINSDDGTPLSGFQITK